MTHQSQYIFDPIVADDERLCGSDCHFKYPGALQTGWRHVIEVIHCWLLSQPFTSTTCRPFDKRLEVFQDGDTCKFKRCPQCRNAPTFLKPVDYAIETMVPSDSRRLIENVPLRNVENETPANNGGASRRLSVLPVAVDRPSLGFDATQTRKLSTDGG